MTDDYLQLDGVEFDYAGTVFHFDLTVRRGECLAVIGPSGAGKSTLLALIAGFEPVAGGRVRIDGIDVTHLAPHKRPVTTLFQEHNLFPHLDLAANVGLGIRPTLRLNAAERVQVMGALARVGLAGLDARKPAQLSGGQRQRAALARLLVRHQPIALLDEPFAALGPALRRDMLELVDELRRELGLTVLLVSHNPEDARLIAERTAYVEDGRVEVVESTETLLGGHHASVAAYLGSVR